MQLCTVFKEILDSSSVLSTWELTLYYNCRRQVLFPFYAQENWGHEILSKFPRVRWLVVGAARFEIQVYLIHPLSATYSVRHNHILTSLGEDRKQNPTCQISIFHPEPKKDHNRATRNMIHHSVSSAIVTLVCLTSKKILWERGWHMRESFAERRIS